MFVYILILLFSVIISAFSQILLKKSANKTYSKKIYEYLNVYVIIGYFIFFLAIILDMIGLKKVPVSFIPIIESSSYIFVIIFSKIFLNETINKTKIVSISLIFAGIIIFLL